MTTNEQLNDKLDRVITKVEFIENRATTIQIDLAVMGTHLQNFTSQMAEMKTELDLAKKATDAAHTRLDKISGSVGGIKLIGASMFVGVFGLFSWLLVTVVDHAKLIATLFSRGGPHG